MSENDLDVKGVSDFLALPEAVRWQVLFFGLVGVKKSVNRLTRLAWAILLAILTNGILTMMNAKI